MQRTHLKWGAFFALAFVAACGDGTGAEYSRALSSYSLARASFEKVGWHKGLAEVSLNRSIVFRERGELHASIVDGDQAS